MIAPLCPGHCQLWWAWTSAADPHLVHLLDHEELHRLWSFVRAEDRALFLVSHALTRIIAAHHSAVAPRAVRYACAARPGGKPRFTGAASELQFSISHSGRRIVVAISRAAPVGVDVEQVSADPPGRSMLTSALCATELRALMTLPPPARPWAFCRFWTRKEAVLKATGDGLGISPKQIAVTAPTAAPALVRRWGAGPPSESVHLYDLDAGPGYAAALATLAEPVEPTHYDGSALLHAWT